VRLILDFESPRLELVRSPCDLDDLLEGPERRRCRDLLELQFIIQGIAEIAVHNNPDIIEDDQAAIIQFIVNLLINLLQNR
jgi:hypothetical protein